ncbi:hypothetical protein SDC9_202787 [bioreactor metagenome]|uniref:Uncharacterized protein n=1 Tax=bioreactor metagenome TaxID=1076179 RepID=A0A645IUL3_9ZZZZ
MLTSYEYALRIWSTRITSIATTTSCTIILIRFGIVFLMSEMMKLEKPVTTVTDIAITIAGSSFTVTARAEQIPNTSTVTGFFLKIGSVNILLFISYLFYVLFNRRTVWCGSFE